MEEEAAALAVGLSTGGLAVAIVSGKPLRNLPVALGILVDSSARAALAARLALGEDNVVTDALGANKVAVVTDRAGGNRGVGGGGSDKGGGGEDGSEELELHCGDWVVWLVFELRSAC